MADPSPPPPLTSLVLVFTTARIPEGLLVRGLLESEGIPVTVKGESEGPYRMGPVFLWVPKSQEEQARRIIQEAASSTPGDEDGHDTWNGGRPTAWSTGEPSEPS